MTQFYSSQDIINKTFDESTNRIKVEYCKSSNSNDSSYSNCKPFSSQYILNKIFNAETGRLKIKKINN